MERERRFVELEDARIEVRAEGEEQGPPRLIGYGARFNSLSLDLGGFRERIAPGAFDETIAKDDIRGLVNHNVDRVIGRTRSGTMRLRVDGRGLLYEIDLDDDDPDAQSARAKVARGDITGSSFGFVTLEDSWADDDELGTVRTLVKVRLMDVGPVTFPAYPEATAAVRSLEEWREKVEGAARDVALEAELDGFAGMV